MELKTKLNIKKKLQLLNFKYLSFLEILFNCISNVYIFSCFPRVHSITLVGEGYNNKTLTLTRMWIKNCQKNQVVVKKSPDRRGRVEVLVLKASRMKVIISKKYQ